MRRLMVLSFPLLVAGLLISCSSEPETTSTQSVSPDAVEVPEPSVSQSEDTPEEIIEPDGGVDEAVAAEPPDQPVAVGVKPIPS